MFNQLVEQVLPNKVMLFDSGMQIAWINGLIDDQFTIF